MFFNHLFFIPQERMEWLTVPLLLPNYVVTPRERYKTLAKTFLAFFLSYHRKCMSSLRKKGRKYGKITKALYNMKPYSCGPCFKQSKHLSAFSVCAQIKT